jgi:hypothetical protein
MYNDEQMPSFVVAPYQVRFEKSGRLACLLRDSDEVIRKQPLRRRFAKFMFPPQRRTFASVSAAFQAPDLHKRGVSPPAWIQQRPSPHFFSTLVRSMRRLK